MDCNEECEPFIVQVKLLFRLVLIDLYKNVIDKLILLPTNSIDGILIVTQ